MARRCPPPSMVSSSPAEQAWVSPLLWWAAPWPPFPTGLAGQGRKQLSPFASLSHSWTLIHVRTRPEQFKRAKLFAVSLSCVIPIAPRCLGSYISESICSSPRVSVDLNVLSRPPWMTRMLLSWTCHLPLNRPLGFLEGRLFYLLSPRWLRRTLRLVRCCPRDSYRRRSPHHLLLAHALPCISHQ